VRDVDLIRGEFVELEPDVPIVEAVPAAGVGPGTATLRARVIPNGAPTMVRFEYGPTTDYGESTPDTDIGEGFANVPVDSVLTGLDADQGMSRLRRGSAAGFRGRATDAHRRDLVKAALLVVERNPPEVERAGCPAADRARRALAGGGGIADVAEPGGMFGHG
jgi:hypothetical protein